MKFSRIEDELESLQICEDFNSDKFLLHFELAVFLKNWIVNHIMMVDRKYTDFLNSKGIY